MQEASFFSIRNGFQETRCVRDWSRVITHLLRQQLTTSITIMLTIRLYIEHTMLLKWKERLPWQQREEWQVKESQVGFIKVVSMHVAQWWDTLDLNPPYNPKKIGYWTSKTQSDLHWWVQIQFGVWQSTWSGVEKRGHSK